MRFLVLFGVILLCAAPALAIQEQVFTVPDGEEVQWEEYPADATFSKEYILTYIPQFVKTPEGGIAWEILAATKEVAYTDKDAQGFDIEGTKPEFTPAVLKLDKTQITMQGYMFPLEQGEAQSTFLFGPFPISCPYHYHVGPSMVIEVFAKSPVTFTYDPINLKGRMELVPRDDDFNVFYRLRDAEVVP